MVSVRIADNAVSGEPDDVVLQASDADSTAKLCIGAIEKKVRNLEKRKTKLDGYKQKIAGGEKLAKEQMDALEKYESVSSNLEFARELQKQVQGIVVETEKSQEKRLKSERCLGFEEAEDIVKLQSVLKIVNSKQVHSFVTSSEVANLVEFGNVISSSDDLSGDYLQMSAIHLCKYVSKENSPIVGSTYADISATVHKIIDEARASSFQKNNSQLSVIENWTEELKISDNNNKYSDSELSSDESKEDDASVVSWNKPLQDILKNMVGEFTFLQESEVYKQVEQSIVETTEITEPETTEITEPVTTDITEPVTTPEPIVTIEHIVTTNDTEQALFPVNSHPIDTSVFMPKYATIPFTNAMYAPCTSTLPVTHQYAVPAFTSYDYSIQNPIPFPAIYHHAIINGTTYFHQPGAIYTTHQAPPDNYNVAPVEEYPETASMGPLEEAYYVYDVATQPTQSEDRESTADQVSSELSPAHSQQIDEVPSKSPHAPHHQNSQFGRGRGRGNYRGQRNFQNQSRYQRNRPEGDQGYRGQPRPQRFLNVHNAFNQKQE